MRYVNLRLRWFGENHGWLYSEIDSLTLSVAGAQGHGQGIIGVETYFELACAGQRYKPLPALPCKRTGYVVANAITICPQ